MSVRVEVRNVTLRYGKTVALDDLTVQFAPGVIHGLLGRNGSGKTSLLSVIAGFRRATAGEALIDGEPVFENADAVAKIAYLRGAGDTVEHDWPADKVSHALGIAADLRPLWDDDYATRLSEVFELDHGKRIGELSRGQRAALGVVLGLASRAPLTIFDETYLGLDAPSRYAFYDELLDDVIAHPRTVVVSTHLIEEVARLLGHVTIIDHGRPLLTGDADELRSHGATITGLTADVEHAAQGLPVVATRTLGPTTQATVTGPLPDGFVATAQREGLDIGPVGLQDLFVHLTGATPRTDGHEAMTRPGGAR